MSGGEAEDWLKLIAPERLGPFLREALGGDGDLRVDGRALSGSSNVTAFITYGGRDLVVRRPPAGERLPSTHDMMREVRFLQAFAGTAVPAPTVLASSDDESVLGAPFYVMTRSLGAPLQNGAPEWARDPESLGRLCDATIDALAAIHAEPWVDRGLPGRPTGYLERQVERSARLLELTSSARRLRGIGEVTRWVQAHIPAERETTIVHGDFGLHNMLLHPDEPRITAVLDWEMATLGDPIADLIWFLKGWEPGKKGLGNPANYVLAWPGTRTRDELIERYARLSGRTIHDELFYRVFASWKGMVVTEGLYDAFLAGRAANPEVMRFETEIPDQLAWLLGVLEREG